MFSVDAETQAPSRKSGEMDPIQRNCNLPKGDSLFFFFVREFILTIWGFSQVFISAQCLLVFLPILADNPSGMATGLLKGIDDGGRALCLSFHRTEQPEQSGFGLQPSPEPLLML